MGDEYESPSQCYRANLQPEPPNVLPDKNDNAFGRPAPRQLEYESPAETEADENIQMLADFISKGKRENNECVQYADLPNTAPLESGVCVMPFFGSKSFNRMKLFAFLFRAD